MVNFLVSGSRDALPIFSHTSESLLGFFLCLAHLGFCPPLGKTYTNSSRLQEAFLDFLHRVLIRLLSFVPHGTPPLPLPWNVLYYISASFISVSLMSRALLSI